MSKRSASVTMEATGAWEVWEVAIPNDVPDGEEAQWARENFETADDKQLKDSGADSYSITEVEYDG